MNAMKRSPSPSSSFLAFSKKYIPRIDASMRGFFKEKILDAKLPIIREMYALMSEYCLREGKRVRPLVMLLACFGYGKEKNADDVMPIAAVLEMMHSFLLIQDDIIDRSDLRRGGPSLHLLCGRRYGGGSHNRNIGSDVALILADVLFAGALKMVGESNVPYRARERFMKIFSDTYEITAWGQILDILNSRSKKIASPGETALQIATMKTAYYTVYYPMLMGYALAGKNSGRERRLIGDFSLPLGLAFQIRDDILGVFGKEKATGKPSDSDIHEGKVTLLVDGVLERLDRRERGRFISLFTKSKKGKREIEKIRSIIEESGSLAAAKLRHRELVDISRRRLSRLSIGDQYRSVLGGLVELIAEI
jgi:geranylgeranyl diphosphate synthase type I